MSSNRLSGFNVALLAVTMLAVLFGIYGYMRPVDGGNMPRHNRASETADNESDAPSAEKRVPAKNEAPERKADLSEEKKAHPVPAKAETGPEDKRSGSEAVSGPSDRGSAEVSGVVLSALGKPVGGATITARRSNLDLQAPSLEGKDPSLARDEVGRYLAQIQRETRSTTSDNEGKFAFAGLDEHLSYNLVATLAGMGRGKLDRVAPKDNVKLILQPQSWLVGKVSGPGGAAVTQFSVEVYGRNRQWEAKQQSFVSQDGRFRMECQAGVMMVEITASGFNQAAPAEVTIDASEIEHSFVLGAAAILTGVVKDKSGKPMVNASVFTGAGSGRWNGRGGRGRNWNNNGYGENEVDTKTDSMGRYRFDTLAPREYRITAAYGQSEQAQTVTLAVGNNTLDFMLDSGVHVTLKVKDSRGKPVDATEVWFMKKNNQWQQAERLSASEPGVAEFAGLQAGDYTLSVSAPGYPAVRRELKLTGDQTLDIEFPDGAMLSGKLSSSTGSALTGLSIRLIKDGEDENQAWGTGRWTQIQSDGSFRLGPVEPGPWTIDVLGQDWKKVHSEKRSLNVGENTLELTLNTGGSLTVRVADENGKAAGWAYVWIESLTTPGKNYGANCDQQGRATLSFIEPGDYNLRVSAQNLAAPATSVNVRNGAQEVSITLKAPNCARVTSVTPNSQAAKIGLKVGDLLIEYNGEKINSWEDVGKIRRKYKDGEDVTLTIDRNGQLQTFNLKGGTIGIDGESAFR